MNDSRRAFINILRQTRLIGAVDKGAALVAAWNARKANAQFHASSPETPIPPPTLIYEVQGYARADFYDAQGRRHAEAIAGLIREAGCVDAPAILEWGCGPTRILARLPSALNEPKAVYYGCDPHRGAIGWARRAHPELKLEVSGMNPPLPYSDGMFDVVYGVSILTHLSESSTQAWTREIARILKPGGLAILTTHGERAAGRLSPANRARFDRGEYVALGGATPGSRVFSAYINEAGGAELFGEHFSSAALHVEGPGQAIGQDVWTLRKAV